MTVGEFELIDRLSRFLAGEGPGLAVGHGDDAAVLDFGGTGLCLAVDAIVEGRHFVRALSSPEDIGWKAVAVNVSDLAAMGARPVAGVVALCRPGTWSADDVVRLYAGMAEACGNWGLRLVGGDTVDSGELAVAVTVVGDVDPGRAVRRSGAQVGDVLVVTGTLGAAAAALAQAQAGAQADPELLAAHRRPRALPRAGAALAWAGASAMIDLSDGLGADLGHVCAASGVAARVDYARLPVASGVVAAAEPLGIDPVALVCGGGEDFALLAAVPPDRVTDACAAASGAETVPAVAVGEVVPAGRAGPVPTLVLPDGTQRDLSHLGWDHYRR